VIRGIHHVAIVTDDLDAMTTFYCDVLGGSVVFESRWKESSERIASIIGVTGTSATLRMLSFGNAFVELFHYRLPESFPTTTQPAPFEKGVRHVCFDVVDLDAEHARLLALGVAFDGTPGAGSLARSVYGRDPEGNLLEFQETLPPGPFDLPLGFVET
jgi:glyoxylase I family protein